MDSMTAASAGCFLNSEFATEPSCLPTRRIYSAGKSNLLKSCAGPIETGTGQIKYFYLSNFSACSAFVLAAA